MNASQHIMLVAVSGLPPAAVTCLTGYGFHTANHVAEVANQADGRRGLIAALSGAGLSEEIAHASLEAILKSLPPDAARAAAMPVDTSRFGLGALGTRPPDIEET